MEPVLEAKARKPEEEWANAAVMIQKTTPDKAMEKA